MDPRGGLWKRNLGTGHSRLRPAILPAWSSRSPFSVPLSTSTRVQSAFWPLPSLSFPSYLLSPTTQMAVDLLLLPSTILYPPLVPCPHLHLGNHLLSHS